MIKRYEFKIDWTLVFLILLPTFYIHGQGLRGSQMQFFQFAAMALLGIMHANRYVGLFLLWAIFQFIFFQENPNSLALQNLFYGALIYHFIVKCSQPRELRKYFWAFVGILALNAFWCLRQYYQIDPIFSQINPQHQTTFSDLPGFFGLPAFLGNYAAAVLPFCLFLSYFTVPFAIGCLIISKSSFSIVAGAVACLFYFWFKKRIVFWVLLLLIIPSVGYYVVKHDMPTGQFSRRLEAWKVIERESFKKQFQGHGIGTHGEMMVTEYTKTGKVVAVKNSDGLKTFLFNETIDLGFLDLAKFIYESDDALKIKNEMQKKGTDFEIWYHAHNEYLEVFYEGGLVAIFILGFFIFDMFRRFFLYGTKISHVIALMACFVGILLVSFGHFPFRLTRLGGVYVCMMAFLDLALMQAHKMGKEAWNVG